MEDTGGWENRRNEERERWKTGATITAIERSEAGGLNAGVGGDDQVGDPLEALTAVAAVAQEDLASKRGGGGSAPRSNRWPHPDF